MSRELRVKLRHGSEVLVRPIEPGDKEALRRGFERLSEQSRYQRFLTPVAALTAGQLAYLTEVDHHDHEALAAFDVRSGDGVGVARFVRLDGSDAAEAAVTVIDEWHGRGLGTALAGLLADRAREEGIRRFTALLLASNRQMLDVLATLGPTREISRDEATAEIEVELPERGIGEHMAGVLRTAAGGSVELATPPWGLRPSPAAGYNPGMDIMSAESADTRNEVVELLKQAYWMEVETVMSYIANSVNPDGVRAQEVKESLAEDIQEELGHAQQFASRIKELYGVVPGSGSFSSVQSYLQPPDDQVDVVHVIKGVIEAERGAIDHYSRIVDATDGVDPVTQDMVITILHDEQGHLREFEGFLREYEAAGLA